MGRQRTHTPAQALAAFKRLTKRLKRAPTAAEFAKAEHVSQATAWHAMERGKLRVRCTNCKGTGFVACQ